MHLSVCVDHHLSWIIIAGIPSSSCASLFNDRSLLYSTTGKLLYAAQVNNSKKLHLHLRPSSSSYAIEAVIVIQPASLRDHWCCTTHRSISHSGHTEWMKKQRRREENGLRLRSRTTRLSSCEKVSNSGNGMQSSNILILHKSHTQTQHKHSTRFMPSE